MHKKKLSVISGLFVLLVILFAGCDNNSVPEQETDITDSRNATAVVSFTVNGYNASSGYLSLPGVTNFTVKIRIQGVAQYDRFFINNSVTNNYDLSIPVTGQSEYTFTIYSPGGFTFQAELDNFARTVNVNAP
jgi:hypothetical protein